MRQAGKPRPVVPPPPEGQRCVVTVGKPEALLRAKFCHNLGVVRKNALLIRISLQDIEAVTDKKMMKKQVKNPQNRPKNDDKRAF